MGIIMGVCQMDDELRQNLVTHAQVAVQLCTNLGNETELLELIQGLGCRSHDEYVSI